MGFIRSKVQVTPTKTVIVRRSTGGRVRKLGEFASKRSRERAKAQALADKQRQAQLEAALKAKQAQQAKALRNAKSAAAKAARQASLNKTNILIEKLQKERLAKQGKRITGGFVDKKVKPRGKVEKFGEKIRAKRRNIRTEKTREEGVKKPAKIKREVSLAGLAALQVVSDTIEGFKQAPSTIVRAVRNPKNIIKGAKNLPSAIKKSGKQFGQLLRISPTEALAKVGTEIVMLKATEKAFKIVGKVSDNVVTRTGLRGKFVGTSKPGVKLVVKTSKGKKTLEVAGGLKGRLSPTETLRRQTRLAGKTVQGVSAQADDLVNFIKNKKLLRKPIPGEAGLTRGTKKLLKKFDDGVIKSRELKQLDELLQIQGSKGILERSFFADPRGRIRGSRIGQDKSASFTDILTEDISFKAQKPQILLFPDTKIQKFPKNLKSIQNKLKRGVSLTKRESDKLLAFQLKKSGKFKPVGFLSRESEITLAPGEIIKRVRTTGRTIINGKSVPIVEVKIVKASKRARDLLRKANAGKLPKRDLSKLKKLLKRESGFKTSLSSARRGKKFVSIKGISSATVSKVIKKTKVSSRPISRRRISVSKRPSKTSRGKSKPSPSKTSRGKSKPRPSPKPSPKKSAKPSPRPSPRPTSRPPIRPRPRPKPIVKFKRKKKKRPSKKPKKKTGYNVFARPLKKKGKKRKLIKINKVPLSKSKAKDLRNYITDTSLSRTSRIKKSKGKVKRPRLKVPSGYAKKTKKKFRSYKIVKGKRKRLPKGKVIERKRRLLDTKQEKKKIGLRKRIKQLKPKRIKTKTVRRKTGGSIRRRSRR